MATSSGSFDVVIVGGGPAGSAAAFQCLQARLSVAVLEGEAFPRPRPGETLPPGIEPLLMKLGVAGLNYPRFAGHWVAWEGPPRFVPFGSDSNGLWLGFQASRDDFDNRLLRQVAVAGATVLHQQRAIRPTQDDHSGVTGVMVERGLLSCKFLVDASGASHWLARHLGIPFEYSSPRLIVTYGYCEGQTRDDLPYLDADEEGWTWTAQVKPGLAHWTRLNWSGEAQPRDWLPPRVRHLRQVGRSRGADVTWRLAAAPAGPGYFIAGDGAMVLDPASSHGVLKAVMSGMMAGYLIEQHICAGMPSEVVASKYNRWLAAWFAQDASRLIELYRRLRHPPSWVMAEPEKRSTTHSAIRFFR
jgi:flavin-dependent dehydrogenase